MPASVPAHRDRTHMLDLGFSDLAFLGGGLAFFGLTAGYTALCARL